MLARIVLMEDPTPGEPILAELDGVECPNGEKLEIAALTPAGTQVVAHDLGRAPHGCPVYVYTATP